MIQIEIPNGPHLQLENLVLDLNGTLAVDGVLIPGVAVRITSLAQQLQIYLLTANTHGGGAAIAQELGIQFTQLTSGPGGIQKDLFVQQLGPGTVVALGNGANDAAMLRAAALGIAVSGTEGAAPSAIFAADVYSPTIHDALDLLLFPDRLRATLRP